MPDKNEPVHPKLSEAIQSTEITVHNMGSPAAIYAIGQMVVDCLITKIRRAGIYIDAEGNVRVANPVYVYFDPRATVDVPTEAKVKKVRPIITDGKPLLVIPDETGQLWEAELEEQNG